MATGNEIFVLYRGVAYLSGLLKSALGSQRGGLYNYRDTLTSSWLWGSTVGFIHIHAVTVN